MIQPEPAVAAPIAKTEVQLVFAAEGVVKFDPPVEPYGGFALLESDRLADGKRILHDTNKRCAGVAGFNNKLFGHAFSDDMFCGLQSDGSGRQSGYDSFNGVKSFSDMPARDQYYVVGAAFFYLGLASLIAYVCRCG